MRHGLKLAGILLLWLVGLNIYCDCLVPHCIVGSGEQWEFPPFLKPQWQYLCTALTTGNCLSLGLCKGAVKESNHLYRLHKVCIKNYLSPDFRVHISHFCIAADWVISINWLGLIVALPVALMVEKWGIRAGAGVALVLPSIASILLWSATSNPGLYREREGLALFYFFLAGTYWSIEFHCHKID